MAAGPTRSADGGDRAPRVLIVDDDMIIRGVLRSLLIKVGQVADAVGDTVAAWRAMRESPFDLMIFDLNVPSEGGLALCRRVRAEAAFDDVPIVALTARDTSAARAECAAAGASHFAVKPFTPSDILRQLRPFLRLAPSDLQALAEIARTDRGLRVQDAPAARLASDSFAIPVLR